MCQVIYLRDGNKTPVGCLAYEAVYDVDHFNVKFGYAVVHEQDYAQTLKEKVDVFVERLQTALEEEDKYSARMAAAAILKISSEKNVTPAKFRSRQRAIGRLTDKPVTVRMDARAKDSKDGKVIYREDLLRGIAAYKHDSLPVRLRSLCEKQAQFMEENHPSKQ